MGSEHLGDKVRKSLRPRQEYPHLSAAYLQKSQKAKCSRESSPFLQNGQTRAKVEEEHDAIRLPVAHPFRRVRIRTECAEGRISLEPSFSLIKALLVTVPRGSSSLNLDNLRRKVSTSISLLSGREATAIAF